MKKLLLVILMLLLPFKALAQETPITTTSTPSFEYFKVTVFTQGQSAWNKKVPVFVQFTATIDSDKVQIDWDTPSGIEIEPRYPQFFSVKAGQTYTYKALIDPKVAGTYNIAANIIAWQYNTNYTSSGDTLITFDDELLTVPLPSTYTVGVIIKWVFFVGVIAMIGYLGYIYAIKSKKKFDKWFNLPD